MWKNKYWLEQNYLEIEFPKFKEICKCKLTEYYKHQWLESLQNSNKCFYKESKSELKLEKYLINVDPSLKYFLFKI